MDKRLEKRKCYHDTRPRRQTSTSRRLRRLRGLLRRLKFQIGRNQLQSLPLSSALPQKEPVLGVLCHKPNQGARELGLRRGEQLGLLAFNEDLWTLSWRKAHLLRLHALGVLYQFPEERLQKMHLWPVAVLCLGLRVS